jgi:hypothetical protein
MMRTTINLTDDALKAARNLAQRQRLSLGQAVSELIRRAVAAGGGGSMGKERPALLGRFAMLPARDEVITPQHARELLEREDT